MRRSPSGLQELIASRIDLFDRDHDCSISWVLSWIPGFHELEILSTLIVCDGTLHLDGFAVTSHEKHRSLAPFQNIDLRLLEVVVCKDDFPIFAYLCNHYIYTIRVS